MDAVASGDQWAALEAIRDRLALALLDAEPNAAAGLAKQLAEVVRTLANRPPVEESKLDDLAARRARRAAVSDGSGRRQRGG